MNMCGELQERMLESLYGLLDPAETADLERHLIECSACKEAWDKATHQKTALARAARAISDVPEFFPPVDEPAPQPLSAPAAPPASPGRWGNAATWVLLAATAACVGLAIGLDRQAAGRIDGEAAQVAELERQLVAVNSRLSDVPDAFKAQAGRAAPVVTPEQLVVSGPRQSQLGVAAPIRVTLQDIDGKPRVGAVRVELLDEDAQPLAEARTLAVSGWTDLPLADMAAGHVGKALLRVQTGSARVEEPIVLEPATQLVHVALNKTRIAPSDRLLVRALVLDRATLAPAAEAESIRMVLRDAAGQPALPPLRLPLRGGVASGDFSPLSGLAPGRYTVEPTGERLIASPRVVEILPASPATGDLIVENPVLRPGEPLQNSVVVYGSDGKPAANARIAGNANLYDVGEAVQSRGVARFQGTTDAQGKVRFTVPTEKEFGQQRQQLTVDAVVGEGQTLNFSQEIRAVPSRAFVEFRPEGGSLVAGVDNTVYFRVHDALGATTANAGPVTLTANGAVVLRSPPGEPLGVFTFVPDRQAKYAVRVGDGPVTADPIHSLGISEHGVLLAGDAVQTGAKPLRVTLRNRGPAQTVQAIVTCRGQVVHHARFDLGDAPTLATLPSPLEGVHRVTLLSAAGEPLAERLFHRTPARRLDVSVDLDMTRIAAGQEQVGLRVRGTDEAGKALPFWALASVVDERFLRDDPAASPLTQFFLLGDVPPSADWSEAPLLATGADDRRLRLALGVHGWRKVNGPREAEANVRQMADADATGPSFFHRVDPPSETLRREREQRWLVAQNETFENARARQGALFAERTDLDRKLNTARAAFDAAQTRRTEMWRAGAGAVTLGVVGVGLIAALLGIVRLARRQGSLAPFGVGAACAVVGFAMLLNRPGPQIVDVAVLRPKALPVAPLTAPPAPAFPAAASTPSFAYDPPGAVPTIASDLFAPSDLGRFANTQFVLARNDETAAARRTVQSTAPTYARSVTLEMRKAMSEPQKEAGRDSDPSPKKAVTAPKPDLRQPVAPAPPAVPAGLPQISLPPPGPQFAPGAAQMAQIAPIGGNVAKNADHAKAKGGLGGAAADRAEQFSVALDEIQRQFASRRGAEFGDAGTLLWIPAESVPAEGVRLTFDLPAHVAVGRIRIVGHTDDGRLGFHENRIRVAPSK